MEATTAPTQQAITAWKNRADKIVGLAAEVTNAQNALEAKLKPIREKFEPDIEAKKKELKKLVAEFEAFGLEHSDILFAEGSEIRTKVAVITGKLNPAAVGLSEEIDELSAIEALERDKDTRAFVQVKKSLDKAALKKALTTGGKIAEKIVQAGVDLYQGFSVKVTGKGD